MAGLLAARVLTEYADEVVLVDRDELPTHPASRRCVPQASHAHLMQPRGLRVLEGLLPGLAAGLQDAGAVPLDDLSQMSFAAFGRLFTRTPHPRQLILLLTRDRLEHEVRSRVRALDRIVVEDGTQVVGMARAGSVVTGVRLQGDAGTAVLEADLVVDASGRSSRLDRMLAELDLPAPTEKRQQIDVRYVSQPLAIAEDEIPERLVVRGPKPGCRRAFYLFAYESGLRMCTVMGYGTDAPSPDRDGLLGYAEEIAPAAVAEVVRHAEQLGPVTSYRVPADRRRLLQGVLPRGLIVMGDSLCSFNPIYAQGMTVAACQAVALDRALGAGKAGIERRYLAAADRLVDQAWELAVPSDRSILGAPQARRERFEQHYLGRLLDRATWDPEAATAVLDVMAMTRTKQSLMRPTAMSKALRPGVRAA